MCTKTHGDWIHIYDDYQLADTTMVKLYPGFNYNPVTCYPSASQRMESTDGDYMVLGQQQTAEIAYPTHS